MAKQYTVKENDSLWKICEKVLGITDSKKILAKIDELASWNEIADPDKIYVGQVIILEEPTSTTKKTTSEERVTIKHFGLSAEMNNKLFVSWTWPKNSQTENYTVKWEYYTGNLIWFNGSENSVKSDALLVNEYDIPANAKKVRVKVKPNPKTRTVDGKEQPYFSKNTPWSTQKTHVVARYPDAPNEINLEHHVDEKTGKEDPFKFDATAEFNDWSNMDEEDMPSLVQFELWKNGDTKDKTSSSSINNTGVASCTFKVTAGNTYQVRARSKLNGVYGPWTEFAPDEPIGTAPKKPAGFAKCVPQGSMSEPEIHLEWAADPNAKQFVIQYTKKKANFDSADNVTEKTVESSVTSLDITSGIETGVDYFFRMKAKNDAGESEWSETSSTLVGAAPSAPTTWSSSTAVVTGESLTLYWMHNSEDNSEETYANVVVYANGQLVIDEHIKNEKTEKEKGTAGSYEVKMDFGTGAELRWRVRTAGAFGKVNDNQEAVQGDSSKFYGDWSIERVVNVYIPPTVTLTTSLEDGDDGYILTALPMTIDAYTEPASQAPVGYYLTITANESYDTVDNLGNDITINAGSQVYAKNFDISTALSTEISANNISLENNISYTVTCTASMNSGLTAVNSFDFTVAWEDTVYTPNASIIIDEDSYSAYIKPYTSAYSADYRSVTKVGNIYTMTNTSIGYVSGGTAVSGATTTTGEQVYINNFDSTYYCIKDTYTPITDVYLAVYRREYDGTFTEIISGLDGAKESTVTDPHPSLDYARYRIVSTSKSTGTVNYYDTQGVEVGCKAIIIQWDEAWTDFHTYGEEEVPDAPPWTGSLLKLPYNIDVTNKNDLDVVAVEYIGRRHPVSYFGTQVGESATWNTEIDKQDRETIYALRRLSAWQGNVYVREPSGTGYWAVIQVSFSQKHKEVTIPVTFNITRVEGGA